MRLLSASLGLILASSPIFLNSPVRAVDFELAQQQTQSKDALQSFKFNTKTKFVLMPVFDKTGSSSQYGSAGGQVATTNEFATEAMNDAIREAGATTIAWFKVNAAMNKKMGQEGLNRANLTNDMFIPELCQVAKTMGVRYLVRPILLNMTEESSSSTSVNPAAFIPYVGIFARPTKTETKKAATVTLKVEIISVAQEEIIGAQRFEGAVRQQNKDANPASWANSSSTGGMSADMRSALYDAITQSVDFISSKVN